MGHHIDDQGRFSSDKYPDLPPDKIVVSFKDPHALLALAVLALAYEDDDVGLSNDIRERLRTLRSVCEATEND